MSSKKRGKEEGGSGGKAKAKAKEKQKSKQGEIGAESNLDSRIRIRSLSLTRFSPQRSTAFPMRAVAGMDEGRRAPPCVVWPNAGAQNASSTPSNGGIRQKKERKKRRAGVRPFTSRKEDQRTSEK